MAMLHRRFFGILLLFPVLFTSCALNYFYSYTSNPMNKGNIKFLPTRHLSKSYVLLNDSLILNGRNLKSLTIENLPDGIYKVQFACNDFRYKYPLNEKYEIAIRNGLNSIQLVNVPPVSQAYWYTIGGIVALLYIPSLITH